MKELDPLERKHGQTMEIISCEFEQYREAPGTELSLAEHIAKEVLWSLSENEETRRCWEKFSEREKQRMIADWVWAFDWWEKLFKVSAERRER